MDLWSTVLGKISEKLSTPSFETWLLGTTAAIDDDVIIVKAKDKFTAEWLDTRYKELIFDTVRKVAGQTYEIEFIVSNEPFIKELPSEPSSFPKTTYRSAYDELKTLIKDQSNLIEKQQEKIEELEKRVHNLEQKCFVLSEKQEEI